MQFFNTFGEKSQYSPSVLLLLFLSLDKLVFQFSVTSFPNCVTITVCRSTEVVLNGILVGY